MHRVQTGIEQLVQAAPLSLEKKRLGLLCNAASTDSGFVHSRIRIDRRFPGQLTALFSPQHGFFAEKQDNMIESDHGRDRLLGIPVYSLYGDTRKPTKAMMDEIDALIVDLQDVGTRVYTFVYTLSYCMEAAREYGKEIIVLDRPNPLGGRCVEGGCLKPEWASFVGRYPIPMRHGLTIGELALLFNRAFGIGCRLHVIPMQGWRRSMLFPETGLPWVIPSPNLPTFSAALVYPGQVIWEGTNVSEGRGTALPFEIFGSPYLNTRKILAGINPEASRGAALREIVFEPTSNKWAGERCFGFQLHVTDPHSFSALNLSLALLGAIFANHRSDFQWKMPPYEYEFERMPVDLILGDSAIRTHLENRDPIADTVASWKVEIERYGKLREPFLLYS